MTSRPLAQPPKVHDGGFDQWMFLLWKRIAAAGQILWSQLDLTGSDHSALGNLNSANYRHITGAEYDAIAPIAAPTTPNQLVGTNAAGTLLEFKTLAAGKNLALTHSAGGLSIAAETEVYTAGEALGGQRLVTLNASGEAVYADNTNLTHLGKVVGLTLGAAVLGDPVTVQFHGRVSEVSWTWNTALPVYLSTSGLLTQTAPVSGFSLIVGFPVSATELFLNFREPIALG